MDWNKRVGVWAEGLQSDLLLAQPQLSDLELPQQAWQVLDYREVAIIKLGEADLKSDGGF